MFANRATPLLIVNSLAYSEPLTQLARASLNPQGRITCA